MKKITLFTLFVGGVLGIIKIFSIVPFVRMAADDFGFAQTGFNQGIIQSQIYWYNAITGRVTTNFLQTVFGMLSAPTGVTSLYTILTFVVLFLCVFVFFKNLLNSQKWHLKAVVISFVFVASYYLITPNKAESWYWLTGSATYLWPTFLGIGSLGFALAQKQSAWSKSASFLLAFLAGFGNETFGLMFLTLLLAITVYLKLVRSKYFTHLLVVFVGTFISFGIMFLAPGNTSRLHSPSSDEMSALGALLYSVQKGPALLFSIVSQSFVYLGSLFLTLSLFWSFEDVNFGKSKNQESPYIKMFVIVIGTILLSIVFMLPGYKALGRMPPDRTEINLSLVIIMALVFGSLYFSKIISEKVLAKNTSYYLCTTLTVVIFLIVSVSSFTKTIAEDVYIAKNYSSAFDSLFLKLKDASKVGSEGVLLVDPLPNSGLVFSQTLNDDVNHFANRYYSSFFGLKGIRTPPLDQKGNE